MDKIKTVALLGLGAIGSYLASGLQKVPDIELRIIAGGERGERIRKNGVVVNGVQTWFNVVDPAQQTGYADLAILIPKFTGLRQAMRDMENQIGPQTLILAPLNGVEAEDTVAEVYPRENILPSLMRISVVMEGNDCRFDPQSGHIQFGEWKNDELSPRVRMIDELFEAAGLLYRNPRDMKWAIWFKYMANVSENQASAVLGIPYKAWDGSSEHADFVRHALIREVVEVARAEGIELSEEKIKKHDEALKFIRPQNKTSMLQDIEAGRPTEVEMFSGTMMRLGRKHGIPVPINELFYHMLRTLEEKNSGKYSV